MGTAQAGSVQTSPDEDMSRLLGALLPFAQESLEKHGAFYPFGASVAVTGQLLISGIDVTEEMPQHDEIVRSMLNVFTTLAGDGEIRAAGVCTNVRFRQTADAPLTLREGAQEWADAVRFALEHASGVSVQCLLPYRVAAPGKVEFGEITAHEKPAEVFKAA